MSHPFKVTGGLESSGIAMHRESNVILSREGTYIQLRFLSFHMARSFVFFLNPSVVSFLQEKLSCVFSSSYHVKYEIVITHSAYVYPASPEDCV